MNWVLAMASPSQGGQGNPLAALVPFFLIIPIFYFLLIRPQQKKQKEFQSMMTQLKKNDKVITTGGIYGMILNVKDRTIILKIAENVKIEIEKSCIARVVSNESDSEGEQK